MQMMFHVWVCILYKGLKLHGLYQSVRNTIMDTIFDDFFDTITGENAQLQQQSEQRDVNTSTIKHKEEKASFFTLSSYNPSFITVYFRPQARSQKRTNSISPQRRTTPRRSVDMKKWLVSQYFCFLLRIHISLCFRSRPLRLNGQRVTKRRLFKPARRCHHCGAPIPYTARSVPYRQLQRRPQNFRRLPNSTFRWNTRTMPAMNQKPRRSFSHRRWW